jgi:hypothetical protein
LEDTRIDLLIGGYLYDFSTNESVGRVSGPQANALELLTRREGQVYSDYIGQIATGTLSAEPLEGREIALRVKLADLADNLLPSRSFEGSESMDKRHLKSQRILRAIEHDG